MNQPSQELSHVNGETTVSEDVNSNGLPAKVGVSNGHKDTAVNTQPLGDTTPTIKIHKNGSQDESLNQQSAQSFAYLGSTPPDSFRRRCDSMTAREDGDQNESKVLVLYTGGTIGMMRNDEDSKYIIYVDRSRVGY